MQRVSSGYTIIEVIIFLAVSAFLLLISMTFLSGNEGHNRFSQSMRDVQSKMQDWINDVPTGFAGATGGTSGQYHCKSTPGIIRIDNGAANPSNPNENNGGCIFLGKAIQFTDAASPPNPGQESQIYAYPVFGRRTITPPSEPERPVANLVEAEPFAAVGINSYSGSADLTESYTITGGAKVKRIVRSSGVAGDTSHLAAFTLGFNQLNLGNSGSAGVRAYQYPITGNHQPGDKLIGSFNDIDECISMTDNGSDDCTKPLALPNDQWPPSLTDWEICFYNDSNSDTAVLTISSADGSGVSTKLEFKSC